MEDHSVGARDESHESEASQALMLCFDNVSQSLALSLIWSILLRPPHITTPTRLSILWRIFIYIGHLDDDKIMVSL